MGDHVSAEKRMWAGLAIAERNLGETHLGTLAGKVHLARVLQRQKRFEEAERMFHDACKKEKYKTAARKDGDHVDRILALWLYLLCLEEAGKTQGAMDISVQLERILETIGGEGLGKSHKFAEKLRVKKAALEATLMRNASPAAIE